MHRQRERAACEWLTRWEYAHRGLHGPDVPENSLAATKLAIEHGMGIECDIQRSRDDQPMVFHDWELQRLTGKEEATNQRNSAALEKLHYLGSTERIVALPALLSVVAGQVPLLIEIKSRPDYDVDPSCAGVAQAVSAYGGACAVMSFDPRVACWFQEHVPHIICGLAMHEGRSGQTPHLSQRQATLRQAQPDFIAYDIQALPNSWIAELRSEGMPVLSWTVKTPALRKTALEYADALISEGAGLAQAAPYR